MKHLIIILLLLPAAFAVGQESVSKKWYNAINVGTNIGTDIYDERKIGVDIRYSAGWDFKPALKIGAGIGFSLYDYQPNAFIPLYAEITGDFNQKKIRPFYHTEVGYGWWLKENEWQQYENKPGGAYFRPSLGLKFTNKSGLATSVNFGYQLQHAVFKRDYTWDDWVWLEDETRIMQRYSIRVGFVF